MIRLSVNINKIATLRNARGGNVPDVVKFAIDCERFGARGITVHPRPDERHIRYRDVYDLKKVVHFKCFVVKYIELFHLFALNIYITRITHQIHQSGLAHFGVNQFGSISNIPQQAAEFPGCLGETPLFIKPEFIEC